jgi:hypothetical protein
MELSVRQRSLLKLKTFIVSYFNTLIKLTLDMNLEDRKRIFLEILPEEEFIDRRIDTAEMIEPESDSENDNIKFIDEYDKTGERLEKDKKKMKTMTEFTKTKSYTSGFH